MDNQQVLIYNYGHSNTFKNQTDHKSIGVLLGNVDHSFTHRRTKRAHSTEQGRLRPELSVAHLDHTPGSERIELEAGPPGAIIVADAGGFSYSTPIQSNNRAIWRGAEAAELLACIDRVKFVRV